MTLQDIACRKDGIKFKREADKGFMYFDGENLIDQDQKIVRISRNMMVVDDFKIVCDHMVIDAHLCRVNYVDFGKFISEGAAVEVYFKCRNCGHKMSPTGFRAVDHVPELPEQFTKRHLDAVDKIANLTP